MSDDLVKRLRTMDGDRMSIKTIDEAADRIEHLAATNDELEAKLAKAVKALHRISLGSQNSGTTKENLGREARAALAELKGEKS